MSWGLHKPGQGYWVRVMTAAAIAIITFAAAGWLMSQMTVLADRLPKHTWSATIDRVTAGTPTAGDRVNLMGPPPTVGAAPAVLGSVRIESYEPDSSFLKLKDFEPAGPTAEPEAAVSFQAIDNSGFTAAIKNSTSVSGKPMISATYLQGGAAALMLLVGAMAAYYFCGARQPAVEFLISTDMEMKKVNWSTRKDIMTSTMVVVGASFLLAGVLFGIDVIFQQFFKMIRILQ